MLDVAPPRATPWGGISYEPFLFSGEMESLDRGPWKASGHQKCLWPIRPVSSIVQSCGPDSLRSRSARNTLL
jgi:hypothetical protein